jgi:hypothetical protein
MEKIKILYKAPIGVGDLIYQEFLILTDTLRWREID